MKYLFLSLAMISGNAFSSSNAEVMAFLSPIVGVYQMNGKGCGMVTIEASVDGRFINVATWAEDFRLSFADKYKVLNKTLTFSNEETDNAWPNLLEWNKSEIIIRKDAAGRLSSLSFKSGWGKPFYTKNVSTYLCKIL